MYIVTPEQVRNQMKILVYGPQGAGKTVLAATAQDIAAMAPALFLNVEGGMMSVAARGDIAVEDVTSTQQLEALYWKIKQREGEFAAFKTIVLDSLTELQNRNLVEHATASASDKKAVDDISQQDYGKSTTQLRRVLRWYRDLPLHVIFTALPKRIYEKTRKGEEGAVIEVRPSLTDKLCDSVMGYVDFVWYLWPDNESGNERRLLTSDRGLYRAKTRGSNFAAALGQVVAKPTLPQLFTVFCESETVTTATKGGKK